MRKTCDRLAELEQRTGNRYIFNLVTGKGGFRGVNYWMQDKLFLQAEPIFICMIILG